MGTYLKLGVRESDDFSDGKVPSVQNNYFHIIADHIKININVTF